MYVHSRMLLLRAIGVFVLVLLLTAVSACSMMQNIPCIMKIIVLDESGNPYGYLAVSVIDENERVLCSGQATDRGTLILGKNEGMRAGTFTFIVKNVAGKELAILSPDSVTISPGRTIDVTIKVGPPKG